MASSMTRLTQQVLPTSIINTVINPHSFCVYLILALVQSLHRAQPSSTDSSMVLTIMKRDVQ